MQTRIADELHRQNLSSQIIDAINDAIFFYQQEHFFFDEAIDDSSTVTVAGTNLYPGPSDLIEPIKLTLTYNSAETWVLQKRELDWILQMDGSNPPIQGPTTDYCFFAEQFRFWPTPDNAYPITFYYKQQIPPPVNPTDQGYWMTTAEAMIRAKAKAILLSQVIRNYQAAQVEEGIAARFFLELKKQTAGKLFTGRTKATRF